jgi:DNA-directed RNA polymerase alpha subunit
VAAQTREVEIRPAPAEVIIEPNPPQSVSYSMPVASLSVSNLQLSEALTETLDDAGYTVEELAKTTPQQLSSLPGIGIKRANSIIAKAKEYLAK